MSNPLLSEATLDEIQNELGNRCPMGVLLMIARPGKLKHEPMLKTEIFYGPNHLVATGLVHEAKMLIRRMNQGELRTGGEG